MSHDHTLNAAIDFKPGVKLDAVLFALAPLAQSRGWTREQLVQPGAPMDDNVMMKMSGGFVTNLTIFTHGQVLDNFERIVEETAENLGPLVHPFHFEIHYFGIAPVRAPYKEIWAGSRDEVDLARKADALMRAQSMLLTVGVKMPVIGSLQMMRQFLKSIHVADAVSLPPVVSDLAIVAAAVAMLDTESTIEVRSLADGANSLRSRFKVGSEAVEQATRAGASFAIRLPHSHGAWYCFTAAGSMCGYLHPKLLGHAFEHARRQQG